MKKNTHKDFGRKKIVVLWIALVFVLGMFTPNIGSKNVKIMNNYPYIVEGIGGNIGAVGFDCFINFLIFFSIVSASL